MARVFGSRTLMLATLSVLICASWARGECTSTDTEDSPCARFRAYPEIFAGRVVAVEPVQERQRSAGQTLRVTFDGIELIKGTPAPRVTLFHEGPLSWRFEAGQNVIVFARSEGTLWSTDCDSTRLASAVELDALRALRDRRPGGSLLLYSPEWTFRAPRKALVRQGSQVIARGETARSSRIQLGWLPPGRYAVDLFDGDNHFVRTISVVVENCTQLRYDP